MKIDPLCASFEIWSFLHIALPIYRQAMHSTKPQVCSVLAISYLGAKHDVEIWAFKVFFFGQEKHPLEWLLDAQT